MGLQLSTIQHNRTLTLVANLNSSPKQSSNSDKTNENMSRLTKNKVEKKNYRPLHKKWEEKNNSYRKHHNSNYY